MLVDQQFIIMHILAMQEWQLLMIFWLNFLKLFSQKLLMYLILQILMIKLFQHHKKNNIPINILTEKFTKIYNEDMATLGVSLP